jgi:hypothetical protein
MWLYFLICFTRLVAMCLHLLRPFSSMSCASSTSKQNGSWVFKIQTYVQPCFLEPRPFFRSKLIYNMGLLLPGNCYPPKDPWSDWLRLNSSISSKILVLLVPPWCFPWYRPGRATGPGPGDVGRGAAQASGADSEVGGGHRVGRPLRRGRPWHAMAMGFLGHL